MSSKRIFLGSFIQQALLTELFYKAQQTLNPAGRYKWTRTPDNFHLTFHFFGDMPLKDIYKLQIILKDYLYNSFPVVIKITGLDYFIRKGKPSVLYGRVEISDDLFQLHQEIQGLLYTHGFIVHKTNKFVPHITFARIKGVSPAFFDKVQSFNNFESSIVIPQIKIEIIESILSPEGALYKSLKLGD